MEKQELHVVTGALGYSGKYIAQRLIDSGKKVRTITNSTARPNPFGDKLEVHKFNFDNPDKLVESLTGVDVLYNTYWVRFNHKTFQHSIAVDNTKILFEAAKKAGVKRIVHTSITNPSTKSKLEYFEGKAILEEALVDSGIPHTILRPAVLFGKEDILINNIAWILRKFPVFGIFGKGKYRLQPIYVDDFAKLAIKEGQETENRLIDAIGPETFTYKELAQTIGKIIGKQRKIISVSNTLGLIVGTIIGEIKGDVVITCEEIRGLKADLLYTDSPVPELATTKLTDWVKDNKETIGKTYTSELARRKDRKLNY